MGIVYKLYLPNTEHVYIGQTINFKRRKWGHKQGLTKYQNGNDKRYLYKIINENLPFENWTFEILETTETLKERERYYIELLKPNLNKEIPMQTQQEWRIKNKDKIKLNAKIYRDEHKIEKKEYYESHKTEILNNDKKKREEGFFIEKDKKRNCDKIKCDLCEKMVIKRNINQHKKIYHANI